MKVLYVIDSLGRGGAEQVLVLLLPELRRQGLDVTLAVCGGAMDLAPDIEASGIAVHRMRARCRWNLFGVAREIAAVARLADVNLVHANLYFPAVATALMQVLRLSSAHTCVTFHNLAYAGANAKTAKLAFRRRLASWLYPRGIERCFAVSEVVASHYEEALGLEEIGVIPNPVDLRKLLLLTDVPQRPFVYGSDCQIVVPGRLVREKGHADLISAIAILRQNGMRPKVTIAGDGRLRAEIESKVRNEGLSEQVSIIGEQTHTNLMRIVAEADIVVIPSRFEGFGLTALEALALGRAVVATRAGGLPDTVGNAAVLVPASQPEALAEAIGVLLNDPEKRFALGEVGREHAKNFDLPLIAARQIEAYKRLCFSFPQSER